LIVRICELCTRMLVRICIVHIWIVRKRILHITHCMSCALYVRVVCLAHCMYALYVLRIVCTHCALYTFALYECIRIVPMDMYCTHMLCLHMYAFSLYVRDLSLLRWLRF
jgi:hypothetical protein